MSLAKILEHVRRDSLTEEELLYLNKEVVQHINAIRATRVRLLREELKVGDIVTFTGRTRSGRGKKSERYPVEGQVTKVKRKRVIVRCNKGSHWDVSLTSLTKKP